VSVVERLTTSRSELRSFHSLRFGAGEVKLLWIEAFVARREPRNNIFPCRNKDSYQDNYNDNLYEGEGFFIHILP